MTNRQSQALCLPQHETKSQLKQKHRLLFASSFFFSFNRGALIFVLFFFFTQNKIIKSHHVLLCQKTGCDVGLFFFLKNWSQREKCLVFVKRKKKRARERRSSKRSKQKKDLAVFFMNVFGKTEQLQTRLTD